MIKTIPRDSATWKKLENNDPLIETNDKKIKAVKNVFKIDF